MKYLNLLLCFALCLCITSCGDDEDGGMTSDPCDQSEWVGTYNGTIECDGETENVTVTVTASGDDAVVITYETATITTEYTALMLDGCTIRSSASQAGITLNIDINLDGNEITINETLSSGGMNSNCSLTASR